MTSKVLTFTEQLAQFRSVANSYLFELTQEQIERAFSTTTPPEDTKEVMP